MKMKTAAFLVAILAVLLSGCSSTRIIQLDLDRDYSPPQVIPYTNAQDREQYLTGYEEGWVNEAREIRTVVNTKTSAIESKMLPCLPLYPFGTPKSKGFDDGMVKAQNQFDELEKRILINEYGWKERTPKSPEDTARKLADPQH